MTTTGAMVCLLLGIASGCVVPPAVLPSMCGDGFVSESAGEECDDQGMSSTCDIDCTLAVCGDGMVNAMAGEECDTAGSSASCDADCTVARCGDGTVNAGAGEACDDGNTVSGDGCNADCRTSGACGNGTLDTGEVCDDGNTTAGDGCSADCRLESCGNGTLEPGETCDHDAMSTATCDSDCTPVTCGDGLVNMVAGEQCDTAGMSAACDHDCTPVACGDGVVNTIAGEECDTAGDSDTCDDDCTIARCGDGLSCDGTTLWSRPLGGTGEDSGRGIAVDSAGNVLLTGFFDGTADFGGGPLSSGDWPDIFVVKLDAQGQHLWSRRFGGTSTDIGQGIAVDSASNVLLTGHFQGTADFGGGPLSSTGDRDIFVVKLDAQGQHLWSRRFGGASTDIGQGIAVDSAGNVLLTGHFQGTADFGGGPLSSTGDRDIFTVKLDAQGQHLWSRRFGGTSTDIGQGIAVDSAGNALLTGRFQSTVDFGGGPLPGAGGDIFAVKLAPQGQHLWSRRFGGTYPDSGQGIAVDSAGNVLLTGYFQGTADFGGGPLFSTGDHDVFAVKLDSQGQHLWSRRLGGPDWENGSGIATDSAGNVLLTGQFSGAAEFGAGAVFSSGDADVFAAKLNP